MVYSLNKRLKRFSRFDGLKDELTRRIRDGEHGNKGQEVTEHQ